MKKLLFTAENLRLSIEGKKTVTRRLSGLAKINEHPGEWFLLGQSELGDFVLKNRVTGEHMNVKPKYHVGERVYFGENHRYLKAHAPNDFGIEYQDGTVKWWRDNGNIMDYPINEKWRSKMFLKEIFARYFAEITSVGCGRLQDMTEQDAEDEGVIGLPAFKKLWDSINKKMKWEGNWRVFIYQYRMVEK